MIWRVTKPGAKQRALKQWHWWFAWRQVRVPTDGRMSKQHKVWMQWIRRRGIIEHGYEGTYWIWKYALPGDEDPIVSKTLSRYPPGYRPPPMPPCKPPKPPTEV